MANTIVFNGKTYSSPEEMPAEVRQAYVQVMGVFADKDRDGMPDLFEGLGGAAGAAPVQMTSTTIVFNGQNYSRVEHMPPEARRAYGQYQAAFDRNRNGLPDMLEGGLGAVSAAAPSAPVEWPPRSQPIAPAAGGVVSGEGDRGWRAAMALIVVLGLAVLSLGLALVWAISQLPR
jgi:hypothetical protein